MRTISQPNGEARDKSSQDKFSTHFFMETLQTKPHFSLPSLIAIGAAIASYFSSAGWAFMLALIAIACGLLGVVLSMAPSVRGGFISILSLIAGGIGILIAIIKVFL